MGQRPNNSFKPNLLRYTNNMAGKACHVVGSATQVGLTQALAPMETANYVLFLGAVIGGLAVALLPFLVSGLIARKASLPRQLAFSAVSTIATYGLTVAALILQAPIVAASTYLAPSWSSLGHHGVANLVARSAEYLGYVTVVVPVVLTIALPLWLKKHWLSIVSALGANSSFKPKPLRGSA